MPHKKRKDATTYFRNYRLKNKEKIREYYRKYLFKKQMYYLFLKSNPCLDCDNFFHPCQMDFDHRCPKLKEKDVAILANNPRVSIAKMEREIMKCDLVCANCHRLREHYRKLAQ